MTKLIPLALCFTLIICCASAQWERQSRRFRPERGNNDIQSRDYDEDYASDDADYNIVKYGLKSRSQIDKEDKDAMLDVFLHNFMEKLGRTVKIVDNKKITERYDEISTEYFKRLADDTIHTDDGFSMGDATLHLLKVANLVLDSADIREMKKLGVLKKSLELQIKKHREDLMRGGKGSDFLSITDDEQAVPQQQLAPSPETVSENKPLENQLLAKYFIGDELYYSNDAPSADYNQPEGKGFRRLEELQQDDMRKIVPLQNDVVSSVGK